MNGISRHNTAERERERELTGMNLTETVLVDLEGLAVVGVWDCSRGKVTVVSSSQCSNPRYRWRSERNDTPPYLSVVFNLHVVFRRESCDSPRRTVLLLLLPYWGWMGRGRGTLLHRSGGGRREHGIPEVLEVG